MVRQIAEQEFGFVGVRHSLGQFLQTYCSGASGDFAKEIFYQPNTRIRIGALKCSCPGLIRRQTLRQSRQRKYRLLESGVEQGVADELRRRIAFAHMFAVLLMQAVRQSKQPSDLSDGFLHKVRSMVSELLKENSEESDGFD